LNIILTRHIFWQKKTKKKQKKVMGKVVNIDISKVSHMTRQELADMLGMSKETLRGQLRTKYPGLKWPSTTVRKIRRKIARTTYPGHIRRMEAEIAALLPATLLIQVYVPGESDHDIEN
jgi:hypothetical protein